MKNVFQIYQTSDEQKLAIFMVTLNYKDLMEIIRTRLIPPGLKDGEIMTVLEADREFISPLEIP